MKKQILSLFLASAMLCNFTAQAAEYTPLDKKLEIADKVTSLLAICAWFMPIKSNKIQVSSYLCIQFINFAINVKLFTKHKKKTRIVSAIPSMLSIIYPFVKRKAHDPDISDPECLSCFFGLFSINATLLKNIVDGGTVAYDAYNSYKAQA